VQLGEAPAHQVAVKDSIVGYMAASTEAAASPTRGLGQSIV
jgi:hypothetical protein